MKMKILWFETAVPSVYADKKVPTMGWQDALEKVIQFNKNIELIVSFESTNNSNMPEIINGIKYVPLNIHLSYLERKIQDRKDRWLRVYKLIPLAKELINKENPDIIHVFGTEWGFGQIAKYTDIPVVIHMQGSILPYQNAFLPPGYSSLDKNKSCGYNLMKYLYLWFRKQYEKTWEDLELSNYELVKYYMGRTHWDKNLVEFMHPGAMYFHVEEALRPDFYVENRPWQCKNKCKITIVTTGCGSHWKGMDVVLKTAKLLKKHKFDFVWKLVGKMPIDFKKEIEEKEKLSFEDNNIEILGFTQAQDLKEILINADMYVHTAYMENSPNSICEAQALGVPVIATYVGGIPTLVENEIDGVLVPTNDPYLLASEIINLSKDKDRQDTYSKSAFEKARKRHSYENISRQLQNCYHTILANK